GTPPAAPDSAIWSVSSRAKRPAGGRDTYGPGPAAARPATRISTCAACGSGSRPSASAPASSSSEGGSHAQVPTRGAGRRLPQLLAHGRGGRGLGRLGRSLHRGLPLLRALLRPHTRPGDGARLDQA